eukprot:TRINITY_DN4920_c0_g1_i1.p1 TRINITY_DN4920_c0_g1~~TRINITY_DN4920_c0_g1_i1.p1  ORF type:complete len:582 (+),score=196.10 TRINITY_DN4920_c0_g1_i1:80-1747(+)
MPAAKRRRTDPTQDPFAGLLNPTWLSEESRAGFASGYGSAKPYPHVVVKDICTTEGLAALIDEADTKLEATFKETDLFKLYQTLDLANLDPASNAEAPALREKLPNFTRIREFFSGQPFREWCSSVMGIPLDVITDRSDLALQAYSKGGHLLCHDDVIGTRIVSFIIYLTDEQWGAADGGGLELYDVDSSGVLPQHSPSQTVLPLRNTMAVFRVEPGKSFHAVAETLTDRAPRLSLQGWLHAKEPPQGAASKASLAVLKGLVESGSAPGPFTKLPQGCVPEGGLEVLSEADLAFLRSWVAPEYLSPASWASVRKRFQKEGSVILKGFLAKDKARAISSLCTDSSDVAPGWSVAGPPITQRYCRFEGGGQAGAAGQALQDVQRELMQSQQFARLVNVLTTLVVFGHRGEIRHFRRGSDYTVAHHALLEPDTRLDATLCFAPATGDDARDTLDRAAWASGEVGGFECYLAADESELEAAEVYGNKDDAANDLISVHCADNTLSLVARDEGMLRFVKYLSADAPSSRYDVATVYEILCDASEDDGMEEDEEAEEEEEK